MSATVLVVDDEPDVLFMLRMILEQAGYQVVQAVQGRQAMDRLEEVRPDVIVTDLMMPVMDGRELIRLLRSDPRTAGIPVLLVTANPTEETGADAVVGKPFRRNEILERISALTGRSA